MNRLAVVLAAALVCGVLTGATAHAATTTTTLRGPVGVAYYSTVTLTGTTPQPDQPVTVFAKGPKATRYTPLRRVVSDARGRYRATYPATADQSIFAWSAGGNSPAITVRLVRAHCTTSGPVVRATPRPSLPQGFAQFTAERHGRWAGSRENTDGPDIDLITWYRGRTTVLAHYSYLNMIYEPTESVHPLGWAPDGALVLRMESTGRSHVGGFGPVVGYYWWHGARHPMSHSRTWTAWSPTGVSDAGVVVGWAQTGTGAKLQRYLITWPSPAAAYRVLAWRGQEYTDPMINGRGDIAYTSFSGHATVRTADGRTVYPELRTSRTRSWSSYGITPTGADRTSFYGSEPAGTFRFVIPSGARTTSVVHGVQVTGALGQLVDASGRGSALVVDTDTGGRGTTYLRTASGAFTRGPTRYVDRPLPTAVTVDEQGTVAFTSRTDHAVHFLRCH